jgi:hypothetical protein
LTGRRRAHEHSLKKVTEFGGHAVTLYGNDGKVKRFYVRESSIASAGPRQTLIPQPSVMSYAHERFLL